MEEQKKPADFRGEYVIKGIFTTILGCIAMAVALYGFLWVEPFGPGSANLTPWTALIIGSIGFALLFMRDAIPGFITKIFNKKTD